jgi:hypothetical protein
MPGSFDLDNTTPPLCGDALAVGAYLYTPGADEPFFLFPNIRCHRIDYREGPEPPVARFEYIMDDTLAINFGWPSRFDQLWPIDAQGPYVVNPDDRLVVMAQNPDGTALILFDGFAQVPQVDLAPRAQRVTFTAVGVAAREWDNPVSGRVQRDSDPSGLQDTSGDSDVPVDLPCRFNPADAEIGSRGGYLPNRTPDGADTVRSDGAITLDHPVFMDPGIERSPDPRAYWSISDAIKFLLAEYNGSQTYTGFPDLQTFDALLQVEAPPSGQATFNSGDAESSPLTIRDYDASNKPYPEAIADLLSYAGFVMRWDTGADEDGLPSTQLRIYRRDGAATAPIKWVYLDAAGTRKLDPSRNNVVQLHLARDCNSIVNAWQVETQQRQVEVSVVLAPLFQPAAGDAQSANRKQFFRSSWSATTSATTRRKYRWYGADECGDGHWTGSGTWATTPFDLSAVFPPDDDGTPSYTVRYRPGSQTLVSTDTDGNPLRATLAISFDYQGATGALWDGSGTWQTIEGGWRLLQDRLGIEVTAEDPEQWAAGKGVSAVGGSGATTAIVPGGDMRGVTWWASPPQGSPTNGVQPVLRLTTVIQDDLRMPISAGKRIASPTRFARWRSVDARDHFQYTTIDPSSANYAEQGGNGTDPAVVRDDTENAMAHANQLRARYEFPPLAGSITIPYITTYYEVGDRVEQVAGRAVSLTTNIGQDQGESPTYPWVVGVSWSFEGDRQNTILQLSDRRAEHINRL